MTRPSRIFIATVAAAAVAAPTALAQDSFYSYSYSSPQLGLSVSIARASDSRKVDASITQQCAVSDDSAVSVTSNLTGKLKKNNRIKLKGAAPDGGSGKALLKGKLTLKKFKGVVKINVPIKGESACKVSKRFTAKRSTAEVTPGR